MYDKTKFKNEWLSDDYCTVNRTVAKHDMHGEYMQVVLTVVTSATQHHSQISDFRMLAASPDKIPNPNFSSWVLVADAVLIQLTSWPGFLAGFERKGATLSSFASCLLPVAFYAAIEEHVKNLLCLFVFAFQFAKHKSKNLQRSLSH